MAKFIIWVGVQIVGLGAVVRTDHGELSCVFPTGHCFKPCNGMGELSGQLGPSEGRGLSARRNMPQRICLIRC